MTVAELQEVLKRFHPDVTIRVHVDKGGHKMLFFFRDRPGMPDTQIDEIRV